LQEVIIRLCSVYSWLAYSLEYLVVSYWIVRDGLQSTVTIQFVSVTSQG